MHWRIRGHPYFSASNFFFFPPEEWYSLLWRLHQILPSAFSMCIFPSVTLRWSTSSSAAATGGGKGNEDFIFLFFLTHRSPPADQRFQLKQISFNNIASRNRLAPEHRWNHASSADLDWEISSTDLITERLPLSHSCQCLCFWGGEHLSSLLKVLCMLFSEQDVWSPGVGRGALWPARISIAGEKAAGANSRDFLFFFFF